MSDVWKFVDFCKSHGIVIDAPPPIGEWKRYKTTDKPKHYNGAVKWLGDVGFCQNHAMQTEVSTWHPDKPLDPVELKALQRQASQRRVEDAQKQARAMRAMRDYFDRLEPLRGGHPYLEAKGLTMDGCAGLKVDGDKLVIPAFKGASLMSAQAIWPDGKKLYAKGCPMQGATFPMTRPGASITVHVEGYATGLAVFQSVPIANVEVYFDLGNMVRTAPGRVKAGMHVVAGDNDHATLARMTEEKARNPKAREPINPGLVEGARAAKEIGCGFVYPEGIEGSDMADLLRERFEHGKAAVRELILRGASPVFRS